MSRRKEPVAARQNSPALPPLEKITVAPSDEFADALYNELTRLWEARKEANRIPEHIVLIEFRKHVLDTLNALYKAGRITVGQTINDKYIIPNIE